MKNECFLGQPLPSADVRNLKSNQLLAQKLVLIFLSFSVSISLFYSASCFFPFDWQLHKKGTFVPSSNIIKKKVVWKVLARHRLMHKRIDFFFPLSLYCLLSWIKENRFVLLFLSIVPQVVFIVVCYDPQAVLDEPADDNALADDEGEKFKYPRMSLSFILCYHLPLLPTVLFRPARKKQKRNKCNEVIVLCHHHPFF